jgi:DNA-binding PadR family transcriptional regulator
MAPNRKPVTDKAEEQLPLTPPVFGILLALADGPKHGYAIMQEVTKSTEGRVRLGPGTLYGALDRMKAARWIEETEEVGSSQDERRRYYRLTVFGLRIFAAEAHRLAHWAAEAKRKLGLHKSASAAASP